MGWTSVLVWVVCCSIVRLTASYGGVLPVAVFVVFLAVAVSIAGGPGGQMGHIVEDAAQKLRLTGPQGVNGVVDLRRGDGVLPHHQHRRVGQVRQKLTVGEEARGGESMMT